MNTYLHYCIIQDQFYSKAVDKSSAYQETLNRQGKAFDALDKAGLSKKQKAIVDRVISAANDCSVTYGAVTYELGLQDGIKLMSVLKEMKDIRPISV